HGEADCGSRVSRRRLPAGCRTNCATSNRSDNSTAATLNGAITCIVIGAVVPAVIWIEAAWLTNTTSLIAKPLRVSMCLVGGDVGVKAGRGRGIAGAGADKGASAGAGAGVAGDRVGGPGSFARVSAVVTTAGASGWATAGNVTGPGAGCFSAVSLGDVAPF